MEVDVEVLVIVQVEVEGGFDTEQEDNVELPEHEEEETDEEVTETVGQRELLLLPLLLLLLLLLLEVVREHGLLLLLLLLTTGPEQDPDNEREQGLGPEQEPGKGPVRGPEQAPPEHGPPTIFNGPMQEPGIGLTLHEPGNEPIQDGGIAPEQELITGPPHDEKTEPPVV